MKKHIGKTPWLLACVVLGLVTISAGSPSWGDVKKIPGVIILKDIQNRYGPVTFDHKKHTTLAENCGTCHHTHDKKTYETCGECHTQAAKILKAAANGMLMPCSGCHGEYSPDAPGMPDLKVALHKKCFTCHVGMGDLGDSPKGCVNTCHTRK